MNFNSSLPSQTKYIYMYIIILCKYHKCVNTELKLKCRMIQQSQLCVDWTVCIVVKINTKMSSAKHKIWFVWC